MTAYKIRQKYFTGFCFVCLFSINMLMASVLCAQEKEPIKVPFGEKINYTIKKFGLKVGEASLEYNGPVRFERREAYLITFTADAFRVKDIEKIYLDPKTLYPMVILRDVNFWGKKEKIREEYLNYGGLVRVTKEVKGKLEETVIEKKGVIDNIYAFILRYRQQGSFKVGEKIRMNLPTKDVELTVEEDVPVDLEEKPVMAHFLRSEEHGVQVWFSKNLKHIPLRIDGTGGLQKVSFIFSTYRPEEGAKFVRQVVR